MAHIKEYLCEWESCESGCGEFLYNGTSLDDAIKEFGSLLLMEMCADDDEIEATILDGEDTFKCYGSLNVTTDGWQFNRMED